MNQQLSSWGDSLMSSLSAALTLLFAAIPRIVGFLVILGIGWLFAWLVERLVVAVLRALHVDRFVERAGLPGLAGAGAPGTQGARRAPSAILGLLAKWFVRLITLVVAFDALGVPAVSQVFHQLLMWLPNLAVALAVLFAGGIAANALGDVVHAASVRGGMARPDLPAAVARWAVWLFAILVAANQIGIASAMVDMLFMAIVGALALAVGLSFGLGARDTAAAIVREFYDRNRGRAGRAIDGTLAAANQPRNVHFEGIEQRRALGDRRGSGGPRHVSP